MKRLLTFAALAAAALSTMPARAAGPTQEEMIAEMKKCAVCSALAEKPDLLKSMTWETHKIDGGMLSVSTVPKEKKAEYDAMTSKMLKNVEKVKADEQAGKKVELCPFCTGMSGIMQAGAKQEEVMTSNGSINLVTSKDPAVVEKIHALADHAIAIQKQMAETK